MVKEGEILVNRYAQLPFDGRNHTNNNNNNDIFTVKKKDKIFEALP